MTSHDECRATRAQKERPNAKFSQIRSDGDVDVLQVPAVDAHYRPQSRARDRIRVAMRLSGEHPRVQYVVSSVISVVDGPNIGRNRSKTPASRSWARTARASFAEEYSTAR
jgi:hypothetical protein